MFLCSNLSEANITALSYLSLMVAETHAILMELQYPLPQPRNHQQSNGLEWRVKQYPVKMYQNNFGCQVTSSSSLSSEQHCHNIHIMLSVTPTHHSQGKQEKNPSVWAAPYKKSQSEIKIRYYLEICPVLGQKRSSSVCSQQASSELGRGSQGKAALPALPNAGQRGGPGCSECW